MLDTSYPWAGCGKKVPEVTTIRDGEREVHVLDRVQVRDEVFSPQGSPEEDREGPHQEGDRWHPSQAPGLMTTSLGEFSVLLIILRMSV